MNTHMCLTFGNVSKGEISVVPFSSNRRCQVCKTLFEPSTRYDRICPRCKPGNEMRTSVGYIPPETPRFSSGVSMDRLVA